jgi:phosphoserine phosphatase
MDGTLLLGTSAPVLVAAALGRGDSLVELEERFAAGAATAVDFARALHECWGVVPAHVARRAFATAPLLANIREVVADIHRHGERACVITMSPDYFAEQLLEFGFDSMSDVVLFREVGLAVSVNGDHHLEELADIAVEGEDLMLAYAAARRWCDSR